MNWRALWTKIAPGVPWVAIALLIAGWFATYTIKERAIGALHEQTKTADASIKRYIDSSTYFRARAQRADHAVDSLALMLVGARAKARASDSVSSVLTLSYRELRDRTLNASPGSLVPTPTQIFASADAAVNACELAKSDCKARADLEQQRGDSARAAAAFHAHDATLTHAALDSSQQNETRLKHAIPSAAATTIRAAWWGGVGMTIAYVACRFLVHCQ